MSLFWCGSVCCSGMELRGRGRLPAGHIAITETCDVLVVFGVVLFAVQRLQRSHKQTCYSRQAE